MSLIALSSTQKSCVAAKGNFVCLTASAAAATAECIWQLLNVFFCMLHLFLEICASLLLPVGFASDISVPHPFHITLAAVLFSCLVFDHILTCSDSSELSAVICQLFQLNAINICLVFTHSKHSNI